VQLRAGERRVRYDDLFAGNASYAGCLYAYVFNRSLNIIDGNEVAYLKSVVEKYGEIAEYILQNSLRRKGYGNASDSEARDESRHLYAHIIEKKLNACHPQRDPQNGHYHGTHMLSRADITASLSPRIVEPKMNNRKKKADYKKHTYKQNRRVEKCVEPDVKPELNQTGVEEQKIRERYHMILD
jgi:hypothetical protein